VATFFIFILSSLFGVFLAAAIIKNGLGKKPSPETSDFESSRTRIGSRWIIISAISLAVVGSVCMVLVKNTSPYFFFPAKTLLASALGSCPALSALFIASSVLLVHSRLKIPGRKSILFFGFVSFCAITWSWIVPIIRGTTARVNYAAKQPTYIGSTNDLKKTVVVPTLDTPIPQNKNVIWCSSFQLAWNEMKNSVIEEPIKLIDAEELANKMNNASQTKKDIEKDSYYVASGFIADGIVEQIKKEMKQQFPEANPPSFEDIATVREAVLAYSYLNANVKFKYPYRQGRHEFIFTSSDGNKTNVEYFGAWECWRPIYQDIQKQVQILYTYSDPNTDPHGVELEEFAIDLCRYSEPYRIVVAVVEKKDTLQNTFDYVSYKIAEYQKTDPLCKFDKTDEVFLPEMFWKIDHRFEELIGKLLDNENYKGWPIIEALQQIKFSLDRSGAFLESQSVLAIAGIPRAFVFDEPFLIYMKKRDAENPFFVMWVDNAELLKKR